MKPTVLIVDDNTSFLSAAVGGYGRLGPVGTFWLLTKCQGRENQPRSR
jgi:hypothetical protein